MTSADATARSAMDDELLALPPPRRPFRRLTFVVMSVTALLAAWLCFGLRGELVYAFKGGAPADIGELAAVSPNALAANAWVHAEATLASKVVRYTRPLESGTYRLAPVEGHAAVWVQLKVPPEADDEHFVQPASFVGRLIPARDAGLRYRALLGAAREAGHPLPDDGWLLIDGESPASVRWVLALAALLVAFVAFNVTGLLRLVRPVRDS